MSEVTNCFIKIKFNSLNLWICHFWMSYSLAVRRPWQYADSWNCWVSSMLNVGVLFYCVQLPGAGRGWSYAGHGLWTSDQAHCGEGHDATGRHQTDPHVQCYIPEGNSGQAQWWYIKCLFHHCFGILAFLLVQILVDQHLLSLIHTVGDFTFWLRLSLSES